MELREETASCVRFLETFPGDCRLKETAKGSKCVETGLLDSACRKQRDGGKHQSVAMGPKLTISDEEYLAALTQWKTAGMPVDSGCTDDMMTQHRRVPGLCAPSISGQNWQQRSFQICRQRFCEGQQTLKQKRNQMRTQEHFCVPDYLSNVL